MSTDINTNPDTNEKIDMSDQYDITEQQNFIEAKIIIQEFHDDSSVFIVGSAPFGKLWFDQEKVDKQYSLLCDNWAEDYDETTSIRSKKPRIISVLISEHDPMFDDVRETIRETQARKNLMHEIAMQMKIAEAVKAAMTAAGIPYMNDPPSPEPEPEPEQLPPPAPTPAPVSDVVIKEKKPRVKKVVPAPVPAPEQNVVLEKKPTKPRQKKATA
jgi:hypothetical protein